MVHLAQYTPPEMSTVFEVIEWESIALAIGLAGAGIVILGGSWAIGFALLKRFADRSAASVLPAGWKELTAHDEFELDRIRADIKNSLRRNYPEELVSDMRINLRTLDDQLEAYDGDIERVEEIYDLHAQDMLEEK